MGLVSSFPGTLSPGQKSWQKDLLGFLHHNHFSIPAYMVIGTDKRVFLIMAPYSDERINDSRHASCSTYMIFLYLSRFSQEDAAALAAL